MRTRPEVLFRHKVLRLLRDKDVITEERASTCPCLGVLSLDLIGDDLGQLSLVIQKIPNCSQVRIRLQTLGKELF